MRLAFPESCHKCTCWDCIPPSNSVFDLHEFLRLCLVRAMFVPDWSHSHMYYWNLQQAHRVSGKMRHPRKIDSVAANSSLIPPEGLKYSQCNWIRCTGAPVVVGTHRDIEAVVFCIVLLFVSQHNYTKKSLKNPWNDCSAGGTRHRPRMNPLRSGTDPHIVLGIMHQCWTVEPWRGLHSTGCHSSFLLSFENREELSIIRLYPCRLSI